MGYGEIRSNSKSRVHSGFQGHDLPGVFRCAPLWRSWREPDKRLSRGKRVSQIHNFKF